MESPVLFHGRNNLQGTKFYFSHFDNHCSIVYLFKINQIFVQRALEIFHIVTWKKICSTNDYSTNIEKVKLQCLKIFATQKKYNLKMWGAYSFTIFICQNTRCRIKTWEAQLCTISMIFDWTLIWIIFCPITF